MRQYHQPTGALIAPIITDISVNDTVKYNHFFDRNTKIFSTVDNELLHLNPPFIEEVKVIKIVIDLIQVEINPDLLYIYPRQMILKKGVDYM